MRLAQSLSGTWQFQLDQNGILKAADLAPDREITVPLPWQAAFPDLASYSGYAWYRRTFELSEAWLGKEVLLEFGAVDYWCEVFVNGQRVGSHEGGYTPFRFRIGEFVRRGINEIAVRVYDSTQTEITYTRYHASAAQTPAQGPPFDARDIPHGKQEWYINVGGIWQDVTLTQVPKIYIAQAHVIPNISNGEALFRVTLGGTLDTAPSGMLRIEIGGEQLEVRLKEGEQNYEARTVVANAHLWNLDDPHLYHATISLDTAHGKDQLTVRFGLREISTRDGQLCLNGAPIFLLSALDQDIYADTIYTVPSKEYLRDEFRKAQELGLNCLRCHIKPPDPIYLDLADEMGLLVWEEIPSWRTFHPKETVHPDTLLLVDSVKSRVRETLQAMLARDMNHPSLIIWTIVNEDWGTSLPLSASDRAWIAEMYDFCKALDPTRLVVDNSACLNAWGPNVHVKSDLDDFHIYSNIPDQARSFEQSMEEFNLRPLWSWSNQGDSHRRGDEPLILSEFGNWGLPQLERLRSHYGGDPPWFDLGPWWSGWEGEPGWPRGVEERFHDYGLDNIWKDYQEFATATQWHEFAALKFQIETLRRQPELAGYVVTELADIYWESNGLLDFLRNPKVFHEDFPSINAPDVLVPEPEHYASWDDDLLDLRLWASHYSDKDWTGALLKWSIRGGGSKGEREITPQARGTLAQVDHQQWRLPCVEATQTVPLEFVVENAHGTMLARNTLEILVLPGHMRRANYTHPVTVIADPRHDLATSLSHLGYQTTLQLSADTEIAITNMPNPELLRWVRDGGRMLFLGNGPNPFYWIQARGGAYSGNWISTYTWLRPGIHKRLDVSNPIGLPFRHCMPTRTILGLPVQDAAVQQDFLAGMISGWVRQPAVHTVQFRYGRGRVIMTTFSFSESLGNRPAAIAMFHDLMDHLASDACEPVLRAN